MSFDFLLRIVGMFVFATVGWRIGDALGGGGDAQLRYIIVLALAGAALGLLITPWVTIRPYTWIRRLLRQVPAQQLLAAYCQNGIRQISPAGY